MLIACWNGRSWTGSQACILSCRQPCWQSAESHPTLDWIYVSPWIHLSQTSIACIRQPHQTWSLSVPVSICRADSILSSSCTPAVRRGASWQDFFLLKWAKSAPMKLDALESWCLLLNLVQVCHCFSHLFLRCRSMIHLFSWPILWILPWLRPACPEMDTGAEGRSKWLPRPSDASTQASWFSPAIGFHSGSLRHHSLYRSSWRSRGG